MFSTSQMTYYCVILAQLKYKAACCSQRHAWPSSEGPERPEPQKGKGSNRNFVFVEITLISLSFNTPMSDFRYLFSCPCHSRVKEKTNISFSSSNTQFYESQIFCLYTFWVFFPDKSFKLKFGYSEKATKFEKIFHLKFDATQ